MIRLDLNHQELNLLSMLIYDHQSEYSYVIVNDSMNDHPSAL